MATTLNVDDMKAKLVGGGARPNLFKVTMGFPSYVTADVSLASYMCKAASMPASTIAPIMVITASTAAGMSSGSKLSNVSST